MKSSWIIFIKITVGTFRRKKPPEIHIREVVFTDMQLSVFIHAGREAAEGAEGMPFAGRGGAKTLARFRRRGAQGGKGYGKAGHYKNQRQHQGGCPEKSFHSVHSPFYFFAKIRILSPMLRPFGRRGVFPSAPPATVCSSSERGFALSSEATNRLCRQNDCIMLLLFPVLIAPS